MLKSLRVIVPLCLVSAAAALAQTAPKVGIVNIQVAMGSTREGQKAADELQGKFEPEGKKLEAMRNDIAGMRDKLNKGQNTMSEAARNDLVRQIDERTKRLNRTTEDLQAEFNNEQNKLLQDLGQKMYAVIRKYGEDHKFSVILDVGNPQTPVLFFDDGIDITKEVIELYDQMASPPASGSAPPASVPPAN